MSVQTLTQARARLARKCRWPRGLATPSSSARDGRPSSGRRGNRPTPCKASSLAGSPRDCGKSELRAKVEQQPVNAIGLVVATLEEAGHAHAPALVDAVCHPRHRAAREAVEPPVVLV